MAITLAVRKTGTTLLVPVGLMASWHGGRLVGKIWHNLEFFKTLYRRTAGNIEDNKFHYSR